MSAMVRPWIDGDEMSTLGHLQIGWQWCKWAWLMGVTQGDLPLARLFLWEAVGQFRQAIVAIVTDRPTWAFCGFLLPIFLVWTMVFLRAKRSFVVKEWWVRIGIVCSCLVIGYAAGVYHWRGTAVIQSYHAGFEQGYANGISDGSIPGAEVTIIDHDGKRALRRTNPK
jgi:hypothetical protein